MRSDPQLLARIVQNLLSNAIRYTEQGSVTLEARRGGTDVEISVSDTGPGIPAESQSEVFREFVQLDSERAGREGIGLGLSIVDRLAKTLGHEIALESEAGSGTRFSLTLQAAPSTEIRPRSQAGSMTGSKITSLEDTKVVVIDDDTAILEATRATLESWGCSVVLATSADDALEGIALRGEPDAILADYRLRSSETGALAIERIRKAIGRPVPAAIISGEMTPEVLSELDDLGLVHVAKPAAPITLRAILTELLREA